MPQKTLDSLGIHLPEVNLGTRKMITHDSSSPIFSFFFSFYFIAII